MVRQVVVVVVVAYPLESSRRANHGATVLLHKCGHRTTLHVLHDKALQGKARQGKARKQSVCWLSFLRQTRPPAAAVRPTQLLISLANVSRNRPAFCWSSIQSDLTSPHSDNCGLTTFPFVWFPLCPSTCFGSSWDLLYQELCSFSLSILQTKVSFLKWTLVKE